VQLARRAISLKTLDTTKYTYASNPAAVYYRMRLYIDAAADYGSKRIVGAQNLRPERIRSREVHLAVPADTTPEQWQQLYKSIAYGRSRGIRVEVTRIK